MCVSYKHVFTDCCLIWIHCTDRETYFLSADIIDALTDHEGFAEKMAKAGLAEMQADGTYRIRGTEGRIEWLAEKRDAAKKGGEARAKSAARDAKGAFKASDQPEASHQPATHPATIQAPSPAEPSPSTSTSSSASTYEEEYIYAREPKKEPALPKGLHRDDIADAIRVWGSTLAGYGLDRDPKRDEVQITRLIQTRGLEDTKRALKGAGMEERSPRYNPAKQCRIARLFDPAMFEQFHTNAGLTDPTTGEIDISKIREAHANERR